MSLSRFVGEIRDFYSDDVSADTLNGVESPEPYQVQQAINRVHAAGGGLVQLRGDSVYEQTGIDVKSNVVLDFNGATWAPQRDADLFNVHPDASILNPRILARDTNLAYSSTFFVYDTAFGDGSYYDGDGSIGMTFVGGPNSIVEAPGPYPDGESQTSREPNTLHYLHGSTDGGSLGNIRTEVNSRNCGIVHDIHHNSDSFITTVLLGGNHIYMTRGLVMREGASASALFANNLYTGQYQTNVDTDVLLDYQAGARCTFNGYLWDPQNATDGAWRIGSGCGNHHQVITHADLSPGEITYNGGGSHDKLRAIETNTGRVYNAAAGTSRVWKYQSGGAIQLYRGNGSGNDKNMLSLLPSDVKFWANSRHVGATRFDDAGNGKGFGSTNTENLSGKTGNFDGEIRRDDGTNASALGGYCAWNGSAWVRADGTTFT